MLVRDGKITSPAGSVRTRPSAKGTDLSLFSDESPVKRVELIERLEMLAKNSGRRFASSARADVGESNLLVESVGDEEIDGVRFAVIKTRRPTLGFNPGQQTGGGSTTLRSKRVKNG